MGKQTAKPFNHTSDRCKNLLDIVHSDVCGPFNVSTMGGARYFVTFIDNHSRWCVVYLLKRKDEVFEKFTQYKNMVENITGRNVKALQTDNGTEFCNEKFDNLLASSGIRRRLSAPRTPEQNGLAERKNRTLVEAVRYLSIHSGLTLSFWGEALMTANYVRNRCPTMGLNGDIPYNVWHGRMPNFTHMRTFGAKVFVLDKTQKSKLTGRTHEGKFVGYSEEAKAFRIWVPTMKRVIVSRDVKFVEENMYTIKRQESSYDEQTTDKNEDSIFKEMEITLSMPLEEKSENEKGIIDNSQNLDSTRRLPGRPTIIRTGKRGSPRKEYRTRTQSGNRSDIESMQGEEATQGDQNSNEEADDVFEDAEANFAHIDYHEALNEKNSEEWKESISEEVKQLIKNDTWDIIEKPSDHKPNIIDSKLVLTNKTDAQGNVISRKARLVARAFAQVYGIDYFKTFAPVVRLECFRILIALAVQLDLKIDQMDITSAFLHGIVNSHCMLVWRLAVCVRIYRSHVRSLCLVHFLPLIYIILYYTY